MEQQIGFIIDENTKTAIAVLFTNIINADGIVYESELSVLKEIRHKYSLTTTHFKDVKTMSLATAINKIITTSKKKGDKLYGMICDDMVKVASVNGSVSSEEAMICLAFRYAYEFQDAHFFEYEYKSIKLAKKEVIYIDDGRNERAEELRDESKNYYDNLSSVLKMYGFTYVCIPTIQRQLMSYSKEFLGNIIEYLYPNRVTEGVIDNLLKRLTGDSLSVFGCQIMQEGAKMKTFPPSLLFKINESTVVSSKDNTRRTVFNLLQLPIKDGCRIQDTIQDFMRKYRGLVSRIHVDDSFDTNVKFNIRSFQRTLVDFYFALDQEFDKVLIKVPCQGRHECILRFGDLTEAKLTKGLVPYYILILYLCKTGKPLLKGSKEYEGSKEWQMHKEIFDAISGSISCSNKFNYNMYNEKGRISKEIKKIMPNNPNWALYVPIRNSKTAEFSIGMDMQVYIKKGKDTYELVEWVESLINKKTCNCSAPL